MLLQKKKRYLTSALVFLFLLLGTGAGFFLLKNSQDVRQQASGGCKPGEPYCSCNLNNQDCKLIDPNGPRTIVEQGSLENLKGILATSFTGERPTTGSACGGIWMNNFCYMPGDELTGGVVVVASGRYDYPYFENTATHDSLAFGAETITNQIGTVQSLGQDCGGNGHLIGNNCYAFGAVVNGYLVMPNRTSGCNNSTGDYCYAHLKPIDVSYSDWQRAVDNYEKTGDSTKLEQLYKDTYGISFQPGGLFDPKASNADLLKAQALIASLTSAQVLQKNAEAENKVLEQKGILTKEEQATYDFNKQIIESKNLDKSYQLLDQLNSATSQEITLNNAISQMYSDLVVADGGANLNNLAKEKFKEIFGYDPSSKYGDLDGILGAFGIDSTQLDKDRTNYVQTVQKQTQATNELNQEYQEYVSGKSSNINDLKQAALDAGVVTATEIKNLSEKDLLALLLSKFSDTTLAQAKQDATAIVTARETSVQEQALITKYIDNQGETPSSEDLLALYKLYVGHAPTYRMTTSELEKEVAKHNSQIALSLYAQTQDVSYLNNYFTSNFNAPATQLTRVLGDPKALLNSIYGEAGNELYKDIVIPNRLNNAIANFSNDSGASLVSVCKELGVTNCSINSTNATTTLSLMLDKMYGGRTDVDVSIPDLAASYSNQIFADSKAAVTDASLDKMGSMMAYSNVSNANASMAIGQWLGNLLMGKTDESVSDLMAANVEPFLESYHEADQTLIIARQAVNTFNASQAFSYATENRAALSDYTWGLSYGNALMSDNILNREFTIDEMDLNVGQTVSLTFNQLSSQIANVDVAQNIATNYATSKYYDYTGPADTRIADIALRGANNIVLNNGSTLLDYDYQAADSGYYTAKTLKSWGESIGGAATYVGALYAASQMNQMALNQSMYLGDTNFEMVDPIDYAKQASTEFKADYHQNTVNSLYENYVVNAEKNNVNLVSFEQFINDPEIKRSSQELDYERLEKVVAPVAAAVVLPAMIISGAGIPVLLGAASSAFSLYQGAGMKAQALEIQRIDIQTRENAVVQSYIENGASETEIADLKLSLDTQVETLNKQGNLMLANSAVAALTSAGGWASSLVNAGKLTGTAGLVAANSGQVLTKAGQIGGIAMNSYNAVNSGVSSYNAFSAGNWKEGAWSAVSSFIAVSGVAGNTFGVFGPTTNTNKIDYILDAMNVPAGAAVDAQQVSQACFGSSDAFSEKDCTNAWIGLALSAGQNVSQISSSYRSYKNDTSTARITDIQKQIDAIDLEILALNGPNKGLNVGLQINDLAVQRARLVDQVASINPSFKVASANSTEDYLAAGMRISLDLETKAQAAIDAGQDTQAMRLIEQAEIFRNKPIEASALRDQISVIDEQVSKKGLFLSTDELADLQQNRNDLVNELETVVKDLSSIESMQKQNDIILQTVKADTAFQELNRLLAVDTQKAELVKIYTPDTEAVTKYINELADAESVPKLETDSNKRLISLEALQGNLSKITELENTRQALANSSNADSEVVKTEISKLDAEISSVKSMVDGVSVDKRTIFRKFADLLSPNKTNNNAYYKSLNLTREAESLKARLADSSLGETDTRNLKNQLAEVNRQLIDQKYLLAQDAANPSKNVIQRVAELVPNIIVNRQITNLKNAAKKLGTSNLELVESIVGKQREVERLKTEDATKNQAEIVKLEAEIADLSKTAANLLKGDNALISVGEENGFTKYIVTENGKDAGIKQEHLNILNKELASFEDFRRQGQTTEEINKYGPFKIYSGTDSFKDQDIFLLAELEAFGAGRRGTVFGALPGMGKTDVVMPFNILLKQRLTNQPQFVVFPEAKLMKPWTSDSDYTPNKDFIDYVESNFGPGSVVIVKANDTSIDPAVLAKAKFVITTKDVAFDLQNTGTQVGLALRNKWRNSFVHADEVDWTFNPNENYKLSGEQVALRDKPEFDLYLNAQKNVLGIDEQGNLSGKGLSSLRNLINQLETSKSIPDGIIRTSDGKGGKFADADLEKQVLGEWLGTWGGQNKIPDLDMSADIAVVREKINNYLSTNADAQTHNHRAELAMINETVNFLSRVPGEDYGLSSNTRMNGDAEEIINSIAPKEQNRDTGRSYSAVAESLLYNTVGARVLGVNGQVDLTKLSVGENGSEINYALLMLESKGFSLYTGTPETVAKLYKMAYGIELKVFTDSAVDDSIARFKKSDSEVFADLESQIASRLTENRDQVFVNMVSGLRSNEVALSDLVTKVSAVDINNQTYKKLMLIGASGKLTEYDLVNGNLQYIRDFPTTDDLNTRTAELNKGDQRYIKFYEYGAHVGVDTANDVNISRAVGLCSGCDATTFAQGINRLRVQVIDDPTQAGKKVTISAPMDVVWLDAPTGKTNLNIDDFAVAINNRQVINEALAEVSFKETLLRNSVDATFSDLVELARNGKKGFLGLGAYRTNQDLVAQLEVAQQKWKETTQMNYMLGSDDLSAQAKLEKTASQVAGAYEELSKLLVGSGEPAKLLATRADGAIGNDKLSLVFSGDDNYKVLGERPSYRQIVELINQSSKHLENVDIAFTNRSSQTEVVQSEMAKAAEVQADASTKNNGENVGQNIFQKTAQVINQNINSQTVQKIVRTPVTLFSSAYSAIVNLFNEEEVAPEILAQRDKAVSDLKITDEQALGDLENLKTIEEINNFVAERQLAYQQLKDQFAALNTVRPAVNNEEDYKTQETKFNETVTEIEALQNQSGLNFFEINENGEISRVNEDQFKNLSTFRAKADVQIEKLAKETEQEKLLAEQKAIKEANRLEQEKLAKAEAERLVAEQAKKEAAEKLALEERNKLEQENQEKLKQEQLAEEARNKAKAEEEEKAKLALEESEKLKQAEEQAALELAKAKEAEKLAKAAITQVLHSIGRNETNSLQTISGIATVSRNHAQIIQDGNNNLYIRDLNSTNGTYINNQKIIAENNVLLKEGDSIFLGNPNSIGVSFKVTKDANNQLVLKPDDSSHIVDNSTLGKAKQAINNVAKFTADALINKFNFKAVIKDYDASAKSAARNLVDQVGGAIANRLNNVFQSEDQNLAEDENNADVASQNTVLPKLNQQNVIDVQNKINNVSDVRGSFNELLWTHNTPFSSLAAIFQSGGISSLSAEGRAYLKAENITEEEFWKRFNQQPDLRKYGKYVKRGFNARYGLSSDFGDIKFVFKPGFEQNKKGYDENLSMITDEPFISDFFNLNGTLFKNKYTSPRNNAEFNLAGFLRGIAQNYGFNKHLSTDLTEGYNPGLGVLERPYINPQMQIAGVVTLDDVQAILVPAHLYDEAIKLAKDNGVDTSKIIKVNSGSKEDYYAYDRSDLKKSSIAARDQAIADGVMRPNRIGRISGSSVTMVTAKEAFEKEQQAYLQIMLDLELSKTTQTNNLSNEFLFNLMIEGLKKQTVRIGSQSFSVKQLFEESAGVWERYSVEESTEMVYRQFNKYFAPNLNNEQKEFFTLLISLHDLGKSMERAQRLPEHSVTIAIAKQILQKLNYSTQEINKFIALIEQDFLGDYFKNITTPDETYKKIKAQAEKYNLNPTDYLNAVYVFYMSDAGSYTKDAGGFISLEGRVFNQNALNNGQLLLNDVNVTKFKQLEKLISSNKVAANSLCSDCDQVRLTTQAGVEKADAFMKESETLLKQADEAKNNNDTSKAQDLITQAETKKQEALKQLNDTRFQVVNSHGMQNQCVQLYLNAWVDTREALIRKTKADIDNAIDSVYKATVLAEKMMDSKQIEIKTNTIFGLGGEVVYQPLSDEEVSEIGDLLFGNEAKNIEGLQSWATFDLGTDGKFNRTVLKGSLLNLDNTAVTSQVNPIRVFLRKFAISSRQMILLDNLKTTLSAYLNEKTEDQPDISVTPIISITISPTPSTTLTPEPISPTPSVVPVSSTTENNVNWHLILNIIATTLSLTLFGSILGHLPIFAAPELPEETPTAIVEEVKKEESVLAPEPTSTPTPSTVITSIPIPTIDEVVEMKIEEEEKEEVIFFNQLDNRWKNIQIDRNTRFGNVGCGVVSVANLTGVSPEQVLKFYEIGSAMGITAKGTGIEANEAALKKLGYETSTGVNGNGVLEDEIRRANSRNDYREVINELNNYQENGDWKIMLNGNFGNLDGGGHWVVVTEVNTDANTITVIDPNGGELKEYALDISGNSGNDNAITPKKLLLAKKV